MKHTPHAIKRAASRFGLKLEISDLREIARQCRSGAPMIDRDCGKGCRKHVVWIQGQLARVIFNNNTGTIVTMTKPKDEEVRHLSAHTRYLAEKSAKEAAVRQ